MLRSKLESRLSGGQGPSSQQPLEMSQLRAANVENTHCLMHRCEVQGALRQHCLKLDESSKNPQSQQEENCLIKLPIDFSQDPYKFPWSQIALSMINIPAFPEHVSLPLSLSSL